VARPVRSAIACLLLTCSSALPSEQRSCEARSAELQEIVQADQADRESWDRMTPEKSREIQQRDRARRMRVGEIFGEGCFSTAEDFAAAALVYQHGDVPDHYLQAFMWAKRAVELGGDSTRLMAVTIDRYLVNTGHKQLFATQAFRSGSCWCLQRVEPSFPATRRQEIGGQSLKEAFAWLAELNAGTDCSNEECPDELEPSPPGTVPGFW